VELVTPTITGPDVFALFVILESLMVDIILTRVLRDCWSRQHDMNQ
jgi:hypothetical protein